jgi:hypothetical protein
MRHLAWLHEVPEGSKKSRLEAFKEHNENALELEMPEIDGAEYLVHLCMEMGLMLNMGVGPFSISWSEIEAWERCTERILPSWERITLKEMSEAYVTMRHKATDKNCPPPYKPYQEDLTAEREAVASKLKGALRAYSANRQK